VEDGLQAMQWLEEKHPDLILLDISMPDLTGEEVCIRLRAMPEYAKLPIIAYTAHAMPQDVERFLDNGFDAVLTKPISLNSLKEALAKVGFSHTA
jgi:CheY-like chemotaxis protein